MVCRFPNRRMADRFSVCVYNFLDKRTTLGEPQLADKRFVKQGTRGFDSRRQIVPVKNSKCSFIADAPNTCSDKWRPRFSQFANKSSIVLRRRCPPCIENCESLHWRWPGLRLFATRGRVGSMKRAELQKFDARAIAAADPNNRLEYMKTIVQTANVEGETFH